MVVREESKGKKLNVEKAIGRKSYCVRDIRLLLLQIDRKALLSWCPLIGNGEWLEEIEP